MGEIRGSELNDISSLSYETGTGDDKVKWNIEEIEILHLVLLPVFVFPFLGYLCNFIDRLYLLTLQLFGILLTRSFVLCVCVVDRCLSFCPFLGLIVLYIVLRYADSGYPFKLSRRTGRMSHHIKLQYLYGNYPGHVVLFIGFVGFRIQMKKNNNTPSEKFWNSIRKSQKKNKNHYLYFNKMWRIKLFLGVGTHILLE